MSGVLLITALDHVRPHRIWTEHLELKIWPIRTHRDPFAPQKFPRFDHTSRQSSALRPNRPRRRVIFGNWH